MTFVLNSLEDLPDSARGGAVAIGNFDGVHLGHARIASRLLEHARRVEGPAVVFTFDPHPVRLLRPESAPAPLTWTNRKAELLQALGVDFVVAYPTDRALLELSPEEFFEQIVQRRLRAGAMVEGPNFFFGHNRQGDIETLKRLCQAAGINLEVTDPVERGGEYISSSRVRRLIAEGAVDEAGAMLTQPYRIRGMVAHGAGRGAGIGFPTANLQAIDTLLPAAGVYAGRAYAAGMQCSAAINVGPNPTFGEQLMKVEAHLIDYAGSLYGQPLELEFLRRLRDIEPFDSVESLRSQLQKDVASCRE